MWLYMDMATYEVVMSQNSSPGQVMKKNRVDIGAARKAVEEIVGKGSGQAPAEYVMCILFISMVYSDNMV